MPLFLLSYFRSWKVVAVLGGVVLAVAAWVYVSHLQHAARNARAREQAATTQSHADTRATQALDHYTHETLIIREKANEAVERVRATPAAGDALDPAVRGALCDAGLCSESPRSGDQRPSGVP